MIVLVARYQVKAGMAGAVLEALTRMARFVKEQEPGCTLYQVNRSTENPDQFLLYEQYADQAAFEGHRQTPHFKEIIETTVMPSLDKRERELYELVIP
jgi:autoinducer 2-degrading protein